jgi:hypothetical protein
LGPMHSTPHTPHDRILYSSMRMHAAEYIKLSDTCYDSWPSKKEPNKADNGKNCDSWWRTASIHWQIDHSEIYLYVLR